MSKQLKQLLILILVLALMIGGFFAYMKYDEEKSKEAKKSTAITVIDNKRDDIVKFSYDYEGTVYSFEKVDGTWYVEGDQSIGLNQNTVNLMLNKLSPLTAEQEIAGVTDMSQFGFDAPTRVIRYETAENAYTVEIGAFNPVSDVYYMRVDEQGTVYVITSSIYNVFDRDLENMKAAQ